MESEMKKINSWCCVSCGWIKEYDQTHQEYSNNECPKLKKQIRKKVIKPHKCIYCGWCPELPQSHVQWARWSGCKYISEIYDTWINEDGEVEHKKKEK